MEQLWSWSKVPQQSQHFCPDINDSLALIHSFHTHTHARPAGVFLVTLFDGARWTRPAEVKVLHQSSSGPQAEGGSASPPLPHSYAGTVALPGWWEEPSLS